MSVRDPRLREYWFGRCESACYNFGSPGIDSEVIL